MFLICCWSASDGRPVLDQAEEVAALGGERTTALTLVGNRGTDDVD